MRILEVVRIALRALARHKLRSALTVLGISIGVGAFICSVAGRMTLEQAEREMVTTWGRR